MKYPPIVEVKRQTVIEISLYDLFNELYSGAANVTILSDSAHQTQPSMLHYEYTPSVITSYFSYSVSSAYQVRVTASNLVSEVSANVAIEAVREYNCVVKKVMCITPMYIRYQLHYLVKI